MRSATLLVTLNNKRFTCPLWSHFEGRRTPKLPFSAFKTRFFNRSVRFSMFFLLFILMAIICQQAQAEQDDSYLRFAEHLFNLGNYESSILEHKRFLFDHTDTDVDDFVRYRIAQGYFYQENSVKVQQMFEELMKTNPDSPLNPYVQLMLGKSYLDAGEYTSARSNLSKIIHADADVQLSAQAQYLKSWCYIHEWNWLKGIAEFRKVSRFQPDTSLSTVSNHLADTTLAKIPLPLKSPDSALWLSTLFPGIGQIYAGQHRNGLISAAVSATFIYLAADASRDERYVDVVGISLLGLWHYWRDRSSAKGLAVEHNRKLAMNLIYELKQKSAGFKPLNFELPEIEIIAPASLAP